MSYSTNVKDEICRSFPKKKSEILAECYGILLFSGVFRNDEIRIMTQSPSVAARIPRLFKRCFGFPFDRFPLDDSTSRQIFEIHDLGKLDLIFNMIGWDPAHEPILHINFALLEDKILQLAFLRGAFLTGGAVTDPSKSYHLEISSGHIAVARELLSLMQERGFQAKLTERKGRSIAYFKRSEVISDFLTAIGAPIASMEVINARLDKTIVSKAYRRSNCDMANVDKTVAAAHSQIQEIMKLLNKIDINQLPAKLKEAADLRIQNPELSLSQLSTMCNPPVTKSAFNHRIQKLLEISRTGQL